MNLGMNPFRQFGFEYWIRQGRIRKAWEDKKSQIAPEDVLDPGTGTAVGEKKVAYRVRVRI